MNTTNLHSNCYIVTDWYQSIGSYEGNNYHNVIFICAGKFSNVNQKGSIDYSVKVFSVNANLVRKALKYNGFNSPNDFVGLECFIPLNASNRVVDFSVYEEPDSSTGVSW